MKSKTLILPTSIFLLTIATVLGQNEFPTPQPTAGAIGGNPSLLSIPESGSQDEIPSQGSGSPLIPGLRDEQFLAEGDEDANNLERPKRLFWDLLGIRNNHYHYHGEGRGYHPHSHYRPYCRHYHNHCYKSPYYHCENVCDSWGYYRY